MKKLLTASILLNAALLVCLFALLKQRNPDFAPPAPDSAKTNAITDAEPAGSEADSFASAEVESADKQSTPAKYSQSAEIALRSEDSRSKKQPIVMPLVFENVDLAQLNLNVDQLQAIEDLRQRFLDEIGGLQQDPHDQAYKERWQRSQPEIDADLRGMIGVTAFQNYQIEAAP